VPRSDRTGDLLSQLDVSIPTQTRLRRLAEPQPAPPADLPEPVKAPPPAPTKTNYWEPTLIWVQENGFTHPSWGGWLQLPREFDAVLALENKAVVQIVLEIMRQTLGWVDPTGQVDDQGKPRRVEWVHLDYDHFIPLLGSSASQARRGIDTALKKKYIERETIKVALERGYVTKDDVKKSLTGKGFVYRIRWSSPKPTVSPLTIPLVYCHINSFQRASSVEKPWPGGEKRRDGRAAHPVAW
jgi:hypothetical protein